MEKVFSITRKTYDRKPTDDLKDLDANTAVWGVFMSVTLVQLGRDYLQNLWSIRNQSSKSVKQIFRSTELLIKDQVEIVSLSTIDWNQSMWRESSHCVIELFILWNPKPTSLLTRCCVWEASLLHQSKLGKTKFKGIWRHAVSKIWIESTGSWRNSSGQFSQDLLQWEFSLKFNRWWRNWGVNLSNSKKGSSSCQCTMTLFGEHQEIMEIVWRIPGMLEHIPRGFRTDVGHFWDLVVRKSGTELMSASQMELNRLMSWCSTLLKAGILYFGSPML